MWLERRNSTASLIEAEAKLDYSKDLREVSCNASEPYLGTELIRNLFALAPVFILVYAATFICVAANQSPVRIGEDAQRRTIVQRQVKQGPKTLRERISEFNKSGVLPCAAIFFLSVVVVLVYTSVVNRRL